MPKGMQRKNDDLREDEDDKRPTRNANQRKLLLPEFRNLPLARITTPLRIKDQPMKSTTLLLVSLFLANASSAATRNAAEKPNVIVIYTDDHGYADLGCMGIMKDVKTPNIDTLAATGVRMTSGYVTAPQCGPSRCGLISGQYQQRFGMEANGDLKGDVLKRFQSSKTLPMRLKEAGYATGMAGKSHLGSNDSGELTKLGFDKVLFKHSDAAGHWNMDLTGKDIPPQVQPKGGTYHLELVADFACTFINRFKDQPFFFYAAFRGPHVPLDAPKKYTNRFPGPMPEERRKALGSLSCIDDGVGKILATLRENKIEENTLIFVIADNGAPLKRMPYQLIDSGNGLKLLDPKTPSNWPSWDGSMNTPMNGEKGMLTEGGIRLPFLVRWKGNIPPGQVYANPVITLDVAATANALAGRPDDSALDGVNLIPFLTGKNPGRPHETLYWRWSSQFAIRKGDWKYLASGDRQYLFNLAEDAAEKMNLIADSKELAKTLRTELETWSKGLIPAGLVPDEMTTASRGHFDYYLDGKNETVSPAETTGKEGERKNKRRKKAATAEGDE
jgi:arylsulfatase A-like enzyme